MSPIIIFQGFLKISHLLFRGAFRFRRGLIWILRLLGGSGDPFLII